MRRLRAESASPKPWGAAWDRSIRAPHPSSVESPTTSLAAILAGRPSAHESPLDQDWLPAGANHVRRCAKSNDLLGPRDDSPVTSSTLAVRSSAAWPQEPLPLGESAAVFGDLAGGAYRGQHPATHHADPPTSRLRRDHSRISAPGRCGFHPCPLARDGLDHNRGPSAVARICAERTLRLGIGRRGCDAELFPLRKTTCRTLDLQLRYRGDIYRLGSWMQHRGCPVRGAVAGDRWRRV